MPRFPDSTEEYDKVIREGANILRRNVELVSREVAAAVYLPRREESTAIPPLLLPMDFYDKFRAVSYVSAEKKTIDAEAAETIAKRFHVPWQSFEIPESDEGLKEHERDKAENVYAQLHPCCEEQLTVIRSQSLLLSHCGTAGGEK